MKIALVPYPGIAFKQMFNQWLFFFADNLCESPIFMLRRELETRDIHLISLNELEEDSSRCDTILHLSPFRKDLLQKYNDKQHFYFAGEPGIVIPIHNAKAIKKLATKVYDAIFTQYRLADAEHVFQIVYPRSIPHITEWPTANMDQKLCCMMGNDKYALGRKELYSQRRKIINFYEKRHPNDFDLYGYSWGPPFNTYQVYRGSIKDKMQSYQNYKFVFCLGNECGNEGNIDEKLLDVLICGRVPIYRGIKDIERFVPKTCFIDYNQFRSVDECHRYLTEMSGAEYEQYQKNIAEYIQNPHTTQLFSASSFADSLEQACRNVEVMQHRDFALLGLYKLQTVVYDKLCNVKKHLVRIGARIGRLGSAKAVASGK